MQERADYYRWLLFMAGPGEAAVIDVAALDQPDTLFGMSPDWSSLNDADKVAVIGEVRQLAGDRLVLPIPSTALIAVAQR